MNPALTKRPNPITAVILSVFCFIAISVAEAQDVERTLENLQRRLEKPFMWSGALSIQLEGYHSSLPIARRAPFNGVVNANLNLEFLGIQTPLSFIYSSGVTAFNVTLPSFGFAGISPTFRDYTLHLGDRSITLGKYSFSNHSFRGIGGEVNKQTWYGRFFYGRLQRATATDLQGFENVSPLFQRMGWGVLAGIRPSSKSQVEVSLFGASDDPNSLPVALDSTFQLSPDANVILSTRIRQTILKGISFDFNFSSSGFTDDHTLELQTKTNSFKSFLGLLKTNATTRWKNAIEFKSNFQTNIGVLNISYERIDPGYRTLGALFFQDDQENISAGISSQLLNKKVSLIAQFGIQNNNLNGDNASDYRRGIGSVQTTFRIHEKLSLLVGYSNFSSINRQVRFLDPEAPNRLTELTLTNNNLNTTLQWQLTDKDHILANYSHLTNQSVTRDDLVSDQINKVNLTNLTYRRLWKTLQLQTSLQFYLNHFIMPQLTQKQNGLALQIQKVLLQENLMANLTISSAQNLQKNSSTNSKIDGSLWLIRSQWRYSIHPKHQLRLDFSWLSNRTTTLTQFDETRVRINYIMTLAPKAP